MTQREVSLVFTRPTDGRTWCGKSTIKEVDGVLTLIVTEWPKGLHGWLTERKRWTVSINKLEEFADNEPEKFADLAQEFWVSKAYSELDHYPVPPWDWREFCDRVLEVAQARNVRVGGFLC